MWKIAAIAFAVAAVLPGPAHPQEWPVKTVRLVLPYPPGSGSDALLRAHAQRFSQQWGQPVVVDNRPGANTILGADHVAKSAPDGYTLLYTTDSTITTNPHLYRNLPYAPLRDFAPITKVATFAVVAAGSPSLQSLADLIARAKAQPGKVTYASIGVGSQHHIVSSLLENAAGISLLQVPYKGIPQATMATLAGEVHMTWGGTFSTKPHVDAGRLRAFGIAGPRRSPSMPNVPTFAEQGYPQVDFLLWYGLFAPAGTPRPVLEKIHAELSRHLADPQFREQDLASKGYDPHGAGLDAFAAEIRQEMSLRAEMVRLSGAKLD